jgi:hypothetical protein
MTLLESGRNTLDVFHFFYRVFAVSTVRPKRRNGFSTTPTVAGDPQLRGDPTYNHHAAGRISPPALAANHYGKLLAALEYFR